MKMVAISFSARGEALVKKLMEELTDFEVEGYYRAMNTTSVIETCFKEDIPLLFVGACGIAVRLIAGCVKDKLTDPPVLVLDEAGRNIIPILSGHVGGANDLAISIAEAIGANPIITTATDVNDTFSIDNFARENRITIHNKEAIKTVSSKVLNGEPIRIQVESLPEKADSDVVISDKMIHGYKLFLSPKKYVLGIGCKKGKSCSDIEKKVEKALKDLFITYDDIYAFGSIDLKADEQGLLDFSRKHRIPFVAFSADMLSKAKGDFEASEFVKQTTGVDNVCERAAVLLSGNKGDIVLKKSAYRGVTVAVVKRAF